MKEKTDCNFPYFFLNQYGFDSKKKKMEQYNHAENFELDWWTFMIVKNNIAIVAACRSKCHVALKTSKKNIYEFRYSLNMHKIVLKIFFMRFTIKIGSC